MTRVSVLIRRRMVAPPEWPPAAAGLLALLALIETILRVDGSGTTVSTTMLLGLLATAPVAYVATHTLAAAATITAATCLTLLMYPRPTAAGLLTLAAAFAWAGRRLPGRLVLPLLVPFAAYAFAVPFGGGTERRVFAVLLISTAAAAAGLGTARRLRAEAAARDASERTVADTLLEHAARGERARIARELHDVVAHHISMIAVQAETARLATPGMPAQGAERLLGIGDTARAALTEMRRLLGVLREDAGTEPTRKPQPGLQQLNELLDEARDSSQACTRLIVRGHVAPLDPGVELTAYRIVQEALTNARRHAPGAAVDVELEYTRDALHLRIRDNGPGAPVGDRSAGHGLLGMRERAAAVGGELRTGPGRISGFVVEARLPAEAEAAP